MADEQVTERDAQQIDELYNKLSEHAGLKARERVDICDIWRLIKPYWPTILRLVRLIPRVGDRIARILEMLGQGLDLFCGGSGETK